MDALELLINRNSRAVLAEPGPAEDELQLMFRAAARAPDHGYLRPWKFTVFEGDQRRRLGEVLAETLATDHALSEKEQHKMLNAPLRAPVVIMAVTDYHESPKVPELEQHLAAGAAVQQLLLTAEALGFGAIWRSGPVSHMPALKDRLGLKESQTIIGFIYIGTPSGSEKHVRHQDIDEFVSYADLG